VLVDLLDGTSMEELSCALAGSYSLTLCGGKVRLLCRSLPGRAISALQRVGEVIYIFVDLDKPSAPRTAWEMIQDWRASFLEPNITDTGTLQLIPLQRIADPPDEPVTLYLAR
jgi:hypothetical protein